MFAMAKLALYLFTILAMSYVSETYKILVVVTTPGKSHDILGESMCKHLLDAGHEVTYATLYPKQKSHQNQTYLNLLDNSEILTERDKLLSLKAVINNQATEKKSLLMTMTVQKFIMTAVQNKHVQKLLNDPSVEFDLVITETLFSDLPLGFSIVFGCPFITFSSVDLSHMLPNDFEAGAAESRESSPSLDQHLSNQNIRNKASSYIRSFYNSIMKLEEMLYNKIFGEAAKKRGRYFPTYDDLIVHPSFAFENSHEPFGPAINLPYEHAFIGGYHIDTDVKPLPKNLQKIMDDAQRGVIYFSMGTVLKYTDLPEEIKKDLLKMFGGLKQTVLWKSEEILPGTPNNVHLLKWAPQHSILAHPNCKLFISHGGYLSTMETLHFGVPIIGIPSFGDQYTSVRRASRMGFAKEIKLTYDLVKDLKPAIEEVLSDPTYTYKAKEMSTIFRDRPVPPAQELVKWVEYVIEKGAPVWTSSTPVSCDIIAAMCSVLLHLPDIIALIGILYGIWFIMRLRKDGETYVVNMEKKNA